jgi:GH24 family phage-related lysozyme (muramidase)
MAEGEIFLLESGTVCFCHNAGHAATCDEAIPRLTRELDSFAVARNNKAIRSEGENVQAQSFRRRSRL